jgi:hypothetical protein
VIQCTIICSILSIQSDLDRSLSVVVRGWYYTSSPSRVENSCSFEYSKLFKEAEGTVLDIKITLLNIERLVVLATQRNCVSSTLRT